MRTIQCLALLAAVFIVACSERPSATAPITDKAALVPSGIIGDQPSQWSLACHSDTYDGGIAAQWAWTEHGVTISGTDTAFTCSTFLMKSSKVSGSGVRPANANEFLACVGDYYCTNWTMWTFDPSGPFTAKLQGSLTDLTWCFPSKKCDPLVTTTSTLTVDS